uniref:Uncharacterized protein n=1 Tax=Megaselia scalaris TaxID=36166 RepID=T1GW30_MEGSC
MGFTKGLTRFRPTAILRYGQLQIRKISSVSRKNEIFNEEQRRQKESVGRIEKIEVRYLGLPEDVTLIMNKGISTPFNCAQHLSEGHCKRSALLFWMERFHGIFIDLYKKIVHCSY